MRLAAILLLCTAALLLLAGVITGSWGEATNLESVDNITGAGTIRWGLMSVTVCDDSGFFLRSCSSHSLHDYGWDQASINVGLATFVIGLLLLVMAAGAAVLTGLEKAFARIAGTATLIASIGAVISAVLFLILLPESATDLEPELGSSFYLFVIGCMASAQGSWFCARAAPRPIRASRTGSNDDQKDTGPVLPPHLSDTSVPGAPRGAMPSPVPIPPPVTQIPRCPSCQGDGTWIQQSRHFICVRCNRYLQPR